MNFSLLHTGWLTLTVKSIYILTDGAVQQTNCQGISSADNWKAPPFHIAGTFSYCCFLVQEILHWLPNLSSGEHNNIKTTKWLKSTVDYYGKKPLYIKSRFSWLKFVIYPNSLLLYNSDMFPYIINTICCLSDLADNACTLRDHKLLVA